MSTWAKCIGTLKLSSLNYDESKLAKSLCEYSLQRTRMVLKHACACEMTCGVHVELVKRIPVTRLDVCACEALYVQSCPCDTSPLLHTLAIHTSPDFTYHAGMHLLCPCTWHSLQLRNARLLTFNYWRLSHCCMLAASCSISSGDETHPMSTKVAVLTDKEGAVLQHEQ